MVDDLAGCLHGQKLKRSSNFQTIIRKSLAFDFAETQAATQSWMSIDSFGPQAAGRNPSRRSNRKARSCESGLFATERLLFSGAACPGSLLKEAARDAAHFQTNLAESFRVLGTTLLAEGDAGNKCF